MKKLQILLIATVALFSSVMTTLAQNPCTDTEMELISASVDNFGQFANQIIGVFEGGGDITSVEYGTIFYISFFGSANAERVRLSVSEECQDFTGNVPERFQDFFDMSALLGAFGSDIPESNGFVDTIIEQELHVIILLRWEAAKEELAGMLPAQ